MPVLLLPVSTGAPNTDFHHLLKGQRRENFFNRNGVDIVIGSHPHVVQEVDVERELSGEVKRITAYSLGNAIQI
ncbi:hypothetical protein MASR1M46_17200 [Bacteroidales bacterium]